MAPARMAAATTAVSYAPERLNIYSRFLNALLPNRKTDPLHHLAGISSALHFLALANALAGALRWMLPGPAAAADFEFDVNLIAFGFYAYIFDVATALVAGRSYFYRWTRLDVFTHHVPFMFVGGFWALATFDVLREMGLESTISYFQQAIRWAMLSCSNEFALGLGGALGREEDRWARLMSTWAGLLYFLVASPVWIFCIICALVTCYKNHGVSFCLVLNAAVPVLYAATQYPLFVTVYFKRLKKLFEIENVGQSLKKSVRKIITTRDRKKMADDPTEDLVRLADVKTWDVRPRFLREAGFKSS
mmetsp:Transcript_37855/g.107046  ORF Transcript_37855/g.107046 Transcript_37855/m.107046 type:complete len:305 (+) Transcript_37855:112-1026(+)